MAMNQRAATKTKDRKATSAKRTFLSLGVACVLLTSCADGIVNSVNLDLGDRETVTITAHCGVATLEVDINGQTWSTRTLPEDAGGNPVEPAWLASLGDIVELELALIDALTLSATVPDSGVTHIYHPDASPPGCA